MARACKSSSPSDNVCVYLDNHVTSDNACVIYENQVKKEKERSLPPRAPKTKSTASARARMVGYFLFVNSHRIQLQDIVTILFFNHWDQRCRHWTVKLFWVLEHLKAFKQRLLKFCRFCSTILWKIILYENSFLKVVFIILFLCLWGFHKCASRQARRQSQRLRRQNYKHLRWVLGTKPSLLEKQQVISSTRNEFQWTFLLTYFSCTL